MYSNQREAYRQFFYIAWQKYQKHLPLDATEKQLVEVILQHPEYHSLLDSEKSSQQEFLLEENPFFHMSLHVALNEQIKLNRPHGIKQIYDKLLSTHHNTLVVEHLIITCLAQILWDAQSKGVAPDEGEYLQKLSELL